MTLVQIFKDWDWPDLLQQTPGKLGIWDDVQFTLGPADACDYAVILNKAGQDTQILCPSHHVWAIMQEPPNEVFSPLHRGDPTYARIYTSDNRLQGERYFHSQPGLAWHVNRDFDELVNSKIPEKTRQLSWVTSSKTVFKGHRERIKFLNHIKGNLKLDLFGKGFRWIDDKWDGLATYRYSLAIENFRNPLYWSEKLSDCFLTWTMPIYYGCSQITDYFPPEAIIQIDIHDIDVIEKIREAVASDAWHRNRDAVAEARQLVLNEYQLFPLIVREIREHENHHASKPHDPQKIILPGEPRPPLKLVDRLKKLWRQFVSRETRQKIARIRQRFE